MAQAPTVAVVPTLDKSAVALNGTAQKLKGPEKVIEFFESLEGSEVILAPMGGPGQNLFVKARDMGLDVHRITWFDLERLVPGVIGTDGEERASALKSAWELNPHKFYQLVEVDEKILMLRELTRNRLNIQDVRKKGSNQYQATWRDIAPLLPVELMRRVDDAASVGSATKEPKMDYTSVQFEQFMASLPPAERKIVELRVMFSNPGMIAGAKADEEMLEARITALASTLDIWNWLHPGKDAFLPQIKGLGPSLGGSLIGEIGDIKRFPTPLHLRSYARYGLYNRLPQLGEVPTTYRIDRDSGERIGMIGEFPRRRRGEVAPWNNYLHRAVWLWSTDQVARYEHIWKYVYYHYKLRELQAHPEPMKVEKADGTSILKFTVVHLDRRAKRKTGSALLNYVFGMWTAGANGQDLEHWFRTAQHNNWPVLDTTVHLSWDAFLNGAIIREADNGLVTKVKEEVERRRKKEPQSDDEQSED